MKIRPVGAEMFLQTEGGWTERQADMTNLIVAIRNFTKAP